MTIFSQGPVERYLCNQGKKKIIVQTLEPVNLCKVSRTFRGFDRHVVKLILVLPFWY